MIYTTKVYFTYLDENIKDSETSEVDANSPEEATAKAFKKTIENWDAGMIGITQIDVM